jgi:hypothetical protein
MTEPTTSRTTLFLSRSWKASESELSFVTRSVAGAASRTTQVAVVVPTPAGTIEADGAFDLFGAGSGPDGIWPSPTQAAWPAGLPDDATVIVDELDGSTRALLQARAPESLVHTILSSDDEPSLSSLRFTGGPEVDDAEVIGLHVPINPLAATHRHNGLGFTGYLLVLSDRVAAPDVVPPTPMAAWLTARFPHIEVVVIEDATAAVWRGRVLRGVVSVFTRTDLWRLLAHARVTIDLAPGRIVARECIESLRFGTPIIVPHDSIARAHADAGGGLSFTNYAELLHGVSRLSDEGTRAAMSSQGWRYADARYGDQQAFVDSVARALGAVIPSGR